MIETKAVFQRKDIEIEASDCVVDKVVQLSGSRFDDFSRNLMGEWDFIRDNPIDRVVDEDGRYHCLLVVSDERRDGILVNAEGSSYARYSAFIPDAEALLTTGRYASLSGLNTSLAKMVDLIADQAGAGNPAGWGVFDLRYFGTIYGIDFMANEALREVMLAMLGERAEISKMELEGERLFVYRVPEPVPDPESISDPGVSKTDMYAYGYGWEGMIPIGKAYAFELYDEGRDVYRLYENDAESIAESRSEIEDFEGMFGVGDSTWVKPDQEPNLQVFILNREKYDKGEVSGEWLSLPASPDELRSLFERIGIDRPSEGAFTITAVRAQDDCIRDHISKYDSLDELNMLALYMESADSAYNFDTFKAVLTSRIVGTVTGTVELINLLDAHNIECFELINVKDAESLAMYYDSENDEKPDGVSFEEYGRQCVKEEGGAFTEWGYIKLKFNDLSPEYTGTIPAEYRITDMALQALRPVEPEREHGEKPSVLERIRKARKAPPAPHAKKNARSKKDPER